MPALFQNIFWENAMLGEGRRVWRRLLRRCGIAGSSLRIVAPAMAALVYVLLVRLLFQYEMVEMEMLLLLELLGLTLFVAALVYYAVSGEREKATWEALILTRLTPGQILAGKLLWRLLLIAVVIAVLVLLTVLAASSTPWYDTSKLGLPRLALAQALIFAWCLLVGAFGMWISARTRRSVTSIGVILALLLGTIIVFPTLVLSFSWDPLHNDSLTNEGLLFGLIFSLNPIVALTDLRYAWQETPYSHYEPGILTFWPSRERWLSTLPAVYSAGALLFILLTYRSLRRLEKPGTG